MKRDMDLVRHILLICEEIPPGQSVPGVPEVAGYSNQVVAYHIHLMGQAGLLKVADTTADMDDDLPQALILSMTWKGHDFADAAKSSAVWDGMKAVMAKLGGGGFDVIVEVLKELAKQQLKGLGVGL